MGSSEEEKLVQMVHDFIESEIPDPCFSSSSNCLPLSTKTHVFSLKDILGNRTKAEEEVLETVVKYMRGQEEAKKTLTLKKWLVMRLKINGFTASLCHSSWVSSTGCPAGDYEYIDIKLDDEKLIVDIDFKSQFEVARPSIAYKQLIETLPSIFVGSEEKLVRIITILCSAAKQSLRESGLHLPPWRTTSYMQCKWLSGHQKSSEVNRSSSFDREEKREEEEEENGSHGYSKMWMPPKVKNKRSKALMDGSSALSTQFSNMSINCC